MVKRFIQSFKSVLFADPALLYKEERGIVDKPFHFPGTNGKGVLLIHGWTSTPYEVRRLGKYLNENGYTVSGPMLRGHGTVPKNLEGVKWTDWLAESESAFDALQKECGQVYVAGTSIGGNLAVLLSGRKKNIAGLVLMATPYRLKFEPVVVAFAKMVSRFKKYNKKFYPPTFGVATTITRLISYQTYPIASALETFDLVRESRRRLAEVTEPCLIMQSTSDHIVRKNSIEKIFQKISSVNKEKRYVKRAYHTFISDIKNEHVFEDILNFLEKN